MVMQMFLASRCLAYIIPLNPCCSPLRPELLLLLFTDKELEAQKSSVTHPVSSAVWGKDLDPGHLNLV